MPPDKNIGPRIRILDSLLQDKKGYTIEQLLRKCNERLEQKDFPLISKRTLQKDLLSIESDYDVEIVKEKDPGDKRSHYIRYADPEFSIYKIPLSPQDSSKIQAALDTILSIKGLPQFDWLHETSELMKKWTLDRENQQRSILLEENLNLDVSEKIHDLYSAIQNKQTLRIVYAPFGKEVEIHQVSPYLLKQFNNRWFLLSHSDQHDFLINLALDRMTDIAKSRKKFLPYPEEDPELFYENIIGVTRKPNEPIEIKLAAKSDLFPYIRTKPIHKSQTQITAECTEDWKVFSIEIIPNYEFYSLILSHGPRIKVLSPTSVKEKLKELASSIIALY
ncbi:WYL domain-containing protein [Algoriphagus kandeliae]|uniref:WYL domain-containing protein n=1 Tax=Algoriphagus kandeliae TaxID=2562278 RepID=A0A4Y9QQJ4_9BACT|nr:WYL domain-containing protein [Algoriphagus kandeliae]TFV94480.1 WYL domain-containing protein [Algoriphagus kandeliae]